MIDVAGVDPHVEAHVALAGPQEVRSSPPHRAQQQRGQAGAQQEHARTDPPPPQLLRGPGDNDDSADRGQPRRPHDLGPALVQQDSQEEPGGAVLESLLEQILLAAPAAVERGVQHALCEHPHGQRRRHQQRQSRSRDPPVPHRQQREPQPGGGHQRQLARVQEIAGGDAEDEDDGAPHRRSLPQRVHRQHGPCQHEQDRLLAEGIVGEDRPAGQAEGESGDRERGRRGQAHAAGEQGQRGDRHDRQRISELHRELVEPLRVVGEPPQGREHQRPARVVAAAGERQDLMVSREIAGGLERMDLVPRGARCDRGAADLPVEVDADADREGRGRPPPPGVQDGAARAVVVDPARAGGMAPARAEQARWRDGAGNDLGHGTPSRRRRGRKARGSLSMPRSSAAGQCCGALPR